jgi:hypothetical protein
VVCWGSDGFGQATPPASVNGTEGSATAIAAGWYHTLAIRAPKCSDGIDNDGDGLIDLDDPECSDAEDRCEAPDADGDFIADDLDTCPNFFNPFNSDWDSNGIGDNCNDFEDGDRDEIADYLDNCPDDFNPYQRDLDSNGVGDACNDSEDRDGDDWADSLDDCPDLYNSYQSDLDSNGVGDACNDSEDRDGDDWADSLDDCPDHWDPQQRDHDGDGIGSSCDNCPSESNPDQSDLDLDGRGDPCDAEPGQAPAFKCRSDQLKAAGKLCKTVLTCQRKYVKNPAKDVDEKKLDLCLQSAAERFESVYEKALERAASGDTACELAEPASAASSQLLGWMESMTDECLVGWSDLDRIDCGVRGYLLKTAGTYCGRLLSAESRFQRRPFRERLDVARSEARRELALTVRERIDAAESKGFSYEGPSTGELCDMVEDVVASILDKVKGQ